MSRKYVARSIHADFRLRTDKWMHMGFGAIIALLSGLFLLSIAGSASASLIWGWTMTFTAIAAVGKEVLDWFHPEKHTCDIGDAVYTVIGGVIAIAILLLFL